MNSWTRIALLLFAAAVARAEPAPVPPPAPYGAVPNASQLKWHELEVYGSVCFDMCTFANVEWDFGATPAKKFNPSDFSAEQIVAACKDGGLQGLIIVTKHHDGFCLWPSKTTEYSVKNSPWKNGQGDMLKEFADAIRAQGLQFGVYLSPWDRNHAEYGRPAYLAAYREQLREILTGYGPVFEVWFDGANGGTGYYGGANERRSIDNRTYYDWPNTWKIVRDLQPEACIFSDAGPEIRWVGNENGVAGDPCWATIDNAKHQPGHGTRALLNSGERGGADWVPAECDFPMQMHPKGWYHHPGSKPATPAELVTLYFSSVGRNASMNIGIAPTVKGQLAADHVASLKGFGERIQAIFKTNLAGNATITASNVRGNSDTYKASNVLTGNGVNRLDSEPILVGPQLAEAEIATAARPARPRSSPARATHHGAYWATDDTVLTPELTLDFGKPTTFSVVSLREHLPLGHRVDDWALDAWRDGEWKEFAKGTCIGARRLWRGQAIASDKIRLRITAAAACPALSEFAVYLEPEAGRKEAGRALGVQMEQGLSKKNWKIVSTTGEAAKTGFGSAAAAIDGNPKTLWHTHAAAGRQPAPQGIVVDMGRERELTGLLYLPRQDGNTVGNVEKYAFHISADGKSWGEPAAAGEFSNIVNSPDQQKVEFAKPARGRYFRFTALHAVGGCVSAAEIGVLGK